MDIVRDMAPYVPGLTARPPEGVFASLRDSVAPDMSVDQIAASDAWRAGWDLLDRGYFWEVHEVWEPVWASLPPNSVERHFVQAGIQFANARLKVRMHRPQAAARLAGMAWDHLQRCRGRSMILGIRPSAMVRRCIGNRWQIRFMQDNA